MPNRIAYLSSFALCVAVTLLSASAHAQTAKPTGRFGVVSDIHLNPFDPPWLAERLAAMPPERWDAVFAAIQSQRAATYGSDTNYALMKATLQAISERLADADFVIVPGDFIAHSFEEKAAEALGVPRDSAIVQNLAAKTTDFVARSLQRTLPGKPLILGLGNDDSACGDYKLEPGGPYLAATAATVRDLVGDDVLDDDFDASYRTGGYYALRHPTVANTVVIVINDALWSAKYEDACAQGGIDGPGAMMTWLESRLAEAKAKGEWVWMVRHIPAGIDAYSTLEKKAPACQEKVVPLLREPFASRLPQLMAEYSDPVQASLSGHIHHDTYRIVTNPDGKIVDVDKVVPAISPVFGQNPGFQIFSYDVATGLPTDFETWYLSDLQDVTLDNPGSWRREYVFTQAYGMAAFSAAAIDEMSRAAEQAGPARQAFSMFYDVSRRPLTEAELPAFVCAVRYQTPTEFNACFCGG